MSDPKHNNDPLDAAKQKELAAMHASKKRPLCHCRKPGIEMYIAKIEERYYVKRMPETGGLHAPTCDSYEPPAELSGLGEVLGSAIKENLDGLTELRFDFSMTKIGGRVGQTDIKAKETDSVKAAGSKLTIKSVLSYLWDQAGFNKWSPAMDGKRTWSVVHRHLMAVAGDKMAKGAVLSEKLYIPEPFSVDKKDEIARRRMSKFAVATAKASGPKPLMLLVGEVKTLAPGRYGQTLVLKHAPGCNFNMADEMYKRIEKQFEVEFDLWKAAEDVRLMVIATFSVSLGGMNEIDEIAFMPTTNNWIPFENPWEELMINETLRDRRFTKCLRYNLTKERPLASFVLNDTTPKPTAMYVTMPLMKDEFHTALHNLIEGSQLDSWIWDVSNFDPPPIPEATAIPAAPAAGAP